ncbi:MAG: SET domain-containing protein-lysine N-methyltransferase [Bacteroidia bacterium]
MDIRFKLRVGASKIDGKGVFSLSTIKARKKIGELSGEIISTRKARQIAKEKKRIAIVEFDNKHALYAEHHDKTLKYINHSCSPNVYMRIFGHHVEFYSLKKINIEDELTCNYGETHHDGKLKCRCGAPNCIGSL